VVHGWREVPRRTPTADDFVADGRYGAAVMVLKTEIGRRASTPADRLRLADLLVLAGKEKEAMALLVGIADEQARGGSRERALEALRRADAIEPGTPGVHERLAALDHRPGPRRASRPTGRRASRREDEPAPSRGPLGRPPGDDASGLDRERLGFVRALAGRRGVCGREAIGPALFEGAPHDLLRRVADGLRVVRVREGEVVLGEGDPGESIFLIVAGAVRVVALGDRRRSLEIRTIEAGAFFGEATGTRDRSRRATVVAVTDCALLEVDPHALARLVAARPAARAILERAQGNREPDAVAPVACGATAGSNPERTAAALRAHFGGAEWSPRVRLRLARLLLEAGREADALAVLASVAQDLAKSGQAARGIGVLRKVERIRGREDEGAAPAPLCRTGRRATPREEPLALPASPSRAAAGAALREQVGALLREAQLLAAHAAPSPAIQEAAHR
jgi:CRP-like cAMP-binding protein